MINLLALTEQAKALGRGEGLNAEQEVARQMQVCNACRYCESFCATFSAMTRRLTFADADIHYLANLCHNCGACLHACQYAPPHDFGINVPQAMARVRLETYTRYAWPAAFGKLYAANGLWVALCLAFGLTVFLCLALNLNGTLFGTVADNNFYNIFPHGLLVNLFLPVFGFIVLSLGLGVRSFWRDVTPATGRQEPNLDATSGAVWDALHLKNLDGGHGEGCHNEDENWTDARRKAHHLTFYGFMLCFLATSVATLYHYVFGWVAPYDLTSLPKLFGVTGGLFLGVGTMWLAWLHLHRHPDHGDSAQRPMDLGFIALLWLTAWSGMLLVVVKASPYMPLVLAVHLGVVMALFLTLPYGKFAHGIFRMAALLRHHVEKRLPNTLGLGSE
jgi:citrate/tricarballylate utilization protein